MNHNSKKATTVFIDNIDFELVVLNSLLVSSKLNQLFLLQE